MGVRNHHSSLRSEREITVNRAVGWISAAVLALGSAFAAEGDVTFRTDVSLVRVDAQVVDRNNRPITGLQREDFVVLEDGQKQEIRNFESEDMPIDVLLLLDVSAACSRILSASPSIASGVAGSRTRRPRRRHGF